MISAFERAKVCYAQIAIRFPKTILEYFSAGPSYSNCKIGLKAEVELSYKVVVAFDLSTRVSVSHSVTRNNKVAFV